MSDSFWEIVREPHKGDMYNNALRLREGVIGMEALRQLFPAGEADAENFVLFSTSGVHGSYLTIEEVEASGEGDVTFLVVHPRMVSMRYGNVRPQSVDDFQFLRQIRQSSLAAIAGIGK